MQKLWRGLLLWCVLVTAVLPAVAQDDTGADGPIVINSDEIGVVFDTTNGELIDPLGPGTHQLDTTRYTLTIYPTTHQTVMGPDEPIAARTSDGQSVEVEISIIFSIDTTQINRLHRNWTDTYVTHFIVPTARSAVRNVAAAFSAGDIYGAGRRDFQAAMRDALTSAFEAEGLLLNNLLLEDVVFSDEFTAAVEARTLAQQELERAQINAERTQIEARGAAEAVVERAKGIAQAMVIIAEGDAEALRIVSEQIAANPLVLQYLYIRILADNVSVIAIPSDARFSADLGDLESLPAGD